MHDARAVGLSQSPTDLRGDVHRLVQRQRSPLDPLLERLAPETTGFFSISRAGRVSVYKGADPTGQNGNPG